MRGVMAFMVWLLSLWMWFQDFIMVCWLKRCPTDQERVNRSVGMEQLGSDEGEHESALAIFLSSLSKETTFLYVGSNDGFKLSAYNKGNKRELLVDKASHGEFIASIALSKLRGHRRLYLQLELNQCEEIVEALVSNNNFKDVALDFSGCSALQVAECVSKLLLGNKAIKHLFIGLKQSNEVGIAAAEVLANGLHENKILETLTFRWYVKLTDEAMEVLIKPLKDNDSILQSLTTRDITNVKLDYLGVMLATNTSLRELNLEMHSRKRDKVYERGYTTLSKALSMNKSLKTLRCAVDSSLELKVLLDPLMPMINNLQANTTLTCLDLWPSIIGGKEGVDVLTNMIRTNTSLLELDLAGVQELRWTIHDGYEFVVAIMEALKKNKTLKTLDLNGCDAVGGYKVLGTMMDMLLENHHLEEIDLHYTPLESSGDAKFVHYELEKKKKMKVWELMKSMANVSPISGRVFLCGNPRAGKTTLRLSMKRLPEFRNPQASQFSKTKLWRKMFGTSKVPKVLERKREIDRTRGIEVDHVECDGIDISIWDMAGQTEYHSFHDLVIPNLSADGSCSLFLLTCNPMQGTLHQKRKISEIKDEVKYWLRFIASNTRRSWKYRPHVSIVMTHHDLWHDEIVFWSCIEDVVVDLKLEFEEVLEFDHKEFFTVNGEDESCARMVFDFMKSHLRQLLKRLPKTIKAYAEVQRLITEWNQELLKQAHAGQTFAELPMLKWEEFSKTICSEVAELQDGDKELARRKQEFVAISLNDGGHIMYHEEGKFVITNPHWFCHDIMGEFLHCCANMDVELEMVSIHGMMSNVHVKRILKNILGGQCGEGLLDATLSMMKKLHMFYDHDDKHIMIPSTLQEKCRRLSWLVTTQLEKPMYVGRRLSCKDAKRTMLSLGFFPRLQVSFFQKFQNNNVGNSYQLLEDVIMFIWDGIQVIIEFDHVDMDIMLASELCQDDMLEFLENGIVRHIQDMLMNPTLGCPGVVLVEHILRPECIEELVEMKGRKDQIVSVEELELEVVVRGFDATHNWKQCGHLKRPYDKVKDLLGNKTWKKFLKKQSDVLKRYQVEILQLSSMKVQKDLVIGEKGPDSTWRSMTWQTLQRSIDLVLNPPNSLQKEMNFKLDKMDLKLDVVCSKVDAILQMQKKILRMQENLWCEVSLRIDDMMELSIMMQQSQVPKLAYLSKVGHKKLLTRFVPGLVEFDLHLMCESRDGIHEVVDQEGWKVNFGTGKTRTVMTMLVWRLKVATILTKIGAHVAGGMGEMVPDFGEGLQLASLILDTPNLIDKMSALCLKLLPTDIKGGPEITQDDRAKAEEWLIEVLELKCKDSTFYQKFRLRKVVYRGVGSGKVSIAWLCDHCEKKGKQSRVLYNAMQ